MNWRQAAIATACLALCGTASAAAFTPGNLVAYRVGTGSGALPVYLDEYQVDGTFVQSLPLSAGASPLTASSTGSEGLLNRSANGQCLTVPGYAVAPGGADPKTGATRGLAFVGADGGIGNGTTLGTAFATDAIRSAVSDDCARAWISGNGNSSSRGVWFASKDASSATRLFTTNSQGITIADGQLLAALAGGGTLNRIGTGLPVSGTQTATPLAGVAPINIRGMAMLDLDGVPGADTLYVAANNDGAGTVQKYAFDGATWVSRGSVPVPGAHGLVAIDLGQATVMLLVTGSDGRIQQLFDHAGRDGALTGTPQTLAAPTEGTFYGLAWAPEAVPAANVPAAPAGLTASATGNRVQAQWQAVAGAAYYLLEVSSDDFATVAKSMTVFGTSQAVNDLDAGSYRLRLRAINSRGGGAMVQSQTVTATAPPTTDLPLLSALSGVVGDAGDPLAGTGIAFTVSDAAAVVSATSDNPAVVQASGLSAANHNGSVTLKIAPVGVGYADITVTMTNAGGATVSRTIKYAASANSAAGTQPRWLAGRSDASTAIVVDADTVLIGDDEAPVQDASGNALPGGNAFSAYGRGSGLPVKPWSLDKTAFGLGADPVNCAEYTGTVSNCKADEEVDIEASFALGGRVYATGSHSNNKNGNSRPDRWRLFAFDVTGSGAATVSTPRGYYRWLREDMRSWDATAAHGLGANYLGIVASSDGGADKAPESETLSGFSIEGMSTSPDDSAAWLGFRAPLVPAPGAPAAVADSPAGRTHALIVPVTNFPNLLAADGGTRGTASIGQPIRLDLGGRGIREIRKNAAGDYLIIAGPPTGATGQAPRNFQLYSWDGRVDAAGLAINLRPRDGNVASITVPNTACSAEGIAAMPERLDAGGSVEILSDCGDADFYGDGKAAKELPYAAWKKARIDGLQISALPTVALSVVQADVTVATASATPSHNGTVRAVALPLNAGVPSWEQVMAGLGADGLGAAASAPVAAQANTPALLRIEGLTPGVRHTLYTVNLPASGIASAVNATPLQTPVPVGQQLPPVNGGPGASVSNGPGAVGPAQWQFASNSTGFYSLPAQTPLPEGHALPFGVLGFVLMGGTPGSTATVSMTLPQAAPTQAVLWKYGPTSANRTDHWYQLPPAAYRFAADRLSVSFSITDGQQGDSDLSTNGVIVDPVAVGVPAALPPGPGAAAIPVPGLSLVAQGLLALSLAAMAALRRRRG